MKDPQPVFKLNKMKKYIVFFIPIILFIFYLLINQITSLLNSSSDIGVFLGLLIICVVLLLTYLTLKKLLKK